MSDTDKSEEFFEALTSVRLMTPCSCSGGNSPHRCTKVPYDTDQCEVLTWQLQCLNCGRVYVSRPNGIFADELAELGHSL